NNINALFDEIPSHLRIAGLENIAPGLNEMAMGRDMKKRAESDSGLTCFLGAGAYEHHIPAAVWQITGRGEFLTAYTPYQAEASQGTLQLLYEYQTMMAHLMGLEVSNASLYDGASALAEAVLMATRANTAAKEPRILIAGNLHPHYRKTIEALVRPQGIVLETLAYDNKTGLLDHSQLPKIQNGDLVALVIAQPNFFGGIEEVDTLTDWAHRHQALVIAVVNPTAMALLKEPGSWGTQGADIVCGEGQPLGIPLASGGPYFGFLCTKMDYVRQMPGRLIGRTVDQDGNPGFSLTLQAREQHIRRAKATSNICTNQGLAVTAATIYMSLLGASGLADVAKASHANAKVLYDALTALPGIQPRFNSPFFHEFVIEFPCAADTVVQALLKQQILAGLDLSIMSPELSTCLLVCVTETKTTEDIEAYVDAIKHALATYAAIA
ncbi:MAG: aminomethyl-transferring glycine dehydrogenase subunit GcvPA, partial [Gammaproteobacteria bacterium]|nr:aminomethyl-transferring glycine dehydrogenase subunit GcvPA [Gammaproteobacteria bacterium]